MNLSQPPRSASPRAAAARRPSLRDVAEHCGVAPMTVSRVINEPETISLPTRERVLSAIRELGYRPRPAARRPAPDAPATIGLLNREYLAVAGYMGSVLDGIIAQAYTLDQNLTLFPGHRWDTDPNGSVRANCDGRCDGMIFVSANQSDPIIPILQSRGTPFVVVGEYMDNAGVAAVDVDNRREAEQMTDYLLALGHRRIGFLGGSRFYQSANQRQDGYRRALARAGLRADARLIVPDTDDAPEAFGRLRRMLARPAAERPTAIFAWNDVVAFGALEAAREQGLRVPEDLSVVGFDDVYNAGEAGPPLTTVRQPYVALGAHAVDLLLAQLRGGPPEKVMLPARLVERASAGPPPPGSNS